MPDFENINEPAVAWIAGGLIVWAVWGWGINRDQAYPTLSLPAALALGLIGYIATTEL